MNKKIALIFLIVLVAASLIAGIMTSCDKKANIDYVEIYNAPKTTYVEGEQLDLTGGQIRVVYKNNTEKILNIESSMVSEFDPYLLGIQFLKILYEDSSATLKVTVEERTVSSARIDMPDANLDIVEGQNLKLENTEIILELVDGEIERIKVEPEMCEGFDRDKVGPQTVMVKYKYGKTEGYVNFVITVKPKSIVSVEVSQRPTKKIYYVGQELNLANGKLTVKFDNGYSEIVDMASSSGVIISELRDYVWDNTIVDENRNSIVHLNYKGIDTSFDVKILERDVENFSFIVTPPVQKQNMPLNVDGLTVWVEYNDNSTERIVLPNEKVRFLDYDSSEPGEKNIQVAFYYAGVELNRRVTQRFVVEAREEMALEIVRPTDKPIYQDTEIDFSDWQYRIIYDNGEISQLTQFVSSMVNWEDGVPITSYPSPGTYTWHIKLSETLDMEYQIEVIPLSLNEDSIKFVDENGDLVDMLFVYLNNAIDTTNVYMQVTYSNGKTREPDAGKLGVQLEPSNVTFDNSTPGVKVANVRYSDSYISEYNTAINVTVIRRVTSVEISSYPKMNYIKNEQFEGQDLEIVVNYEHESSSKVYVYGTSFNSPFVRDGWTLACQYLDDQNRFTHIDGDLDEEGNPINIQVFLNNPGLEAPIAIDVIVTNKFLQFTQAPFYARRVVNGVEQKQSVENLGIVLPGKPIDFGTYFIEVEFEAETRFIEITPEMVKDLDIYNTILTTRNVVVYFPRVPQTAEEEAGAQYRSTSVEVQAVSITGIEIVKAPNKTEYYRVAGGTVALDTTGIKVHILYNNDTRKEIDTEAALESGKLSFAGFTSAEAGIQQINVTYLDEYDNNWETTFTVVVKEATIASIHWEATETNLHWEGPEGGNKAPTTAKRQGEDFVLEGLTTAEHREGGVVIHYPRQFDPLIVVITFTDGSIEKISFEELRADLIVTDYDSESEITKYVKLRYRQGAAGSESVYLTVITKMLTSVLDSISITPDSPQITAVQGADPIIAGVKLLVKFQTDGQTEDDKYVPLELGNIVFSETNPGGYKKTDTSVGLRTVTIIYTFKGITKSVEANIRVETKQLTSIELNEIPKRQYIEGESFDTSLGSIIAHYDNGEIEVRHFSEAQLNTESARFNISTIEFNNSEFSGFDKVQTITVKYSSSDLLSDTKTITFTINMGDRKDLEVRFAPTNRYNFIYGSSVAPSLELWGYNLYSDTTRNKLFSSDSYRVEYIEQNIWLNQAMNPSTDYTVLPTLAGIYVIVVTYDGGVANGYNGDSIHNIYQDTSKRLVIERKKLFISFYAGQSKIYGTENPDILIIMKGLKTDVLLDNPLSLFAYSDNFSSINFNPNPEQHYPSRAYLSDASGNKYIDPITNQPIALNIFDFRIARAGGEVMVESSGAGDYSIEFTANLINSKNYDIIYENSVFKVNRRQVNIVPESTTYIYGNVMPIINYQAQKLISEDTGEEIEDSGLYGTDTLSGRLNRENSNINDVGQYLIVRGDLGLANANYQIVFENSQNSANPQYVYIVKRNIYIRADSSVRVYGEAVSPPSVKYFSDIECTNTSNVFASGDTPEGLGILSFNHDIKYLSPIGTYNIMPIITPQEGSNTNYEIHMSAGVVIVSKRLVNVIANPQEKEYGSSDPANLTYTVTGESGNPSSGLVVLLDENGRPIMDNGVPVTQSLLGTLVRDAGEAVGEYQIKINDLIDQNPNYTISYTSAYLKITKKAIIVKIENTALTKVYDGKKPFIPESSMSIYENINGEERLYSGAETVFGFISVTPIHGLKNVGTYDVVLDYTNVNYTVAFDKQYQFEITQRVARVEYINVPHNMEYTGSPYIISARIHHEDLQYQYHDDGTIQTDENNQYKYDNVDIELSVSAVISQGTYSTRVNSTSDPINYYIPPENNPTISFTVLPRKLVITLLNIKEDGITFEREYNGSAAGFSETEYEVGNKISGYTQTYPLFTMGTRPPEGISDSDVIYNAQNEVSSYPVVFLQNSDDRNFEYVLAKPYRYKIIPKHAKIVIGETYLSKVYDQRPPTFVSGMYNFEESGITLDKEAVQFRFNRVISDDGRSDSDAGEYSIEVSTYNRNYIVSFAQIYFYTIQKKETTLRITGLTRTYNGLPLSFVKEQISTTTGETGITLPQVRNYLNDGSFENFKVLLESITSTANQVRVNVERISINPDSIHFAQTDIATAKNSLEAAKVQLMNNGFILKPENRSFINSSYGIIEDSLTLASSHLTSGNINEAITQVEFATSNIRNSYARIRAENTYLAFEFGSEGITNSSNVGEYTFIFTSNDINVQYTLIHQVADRIATIIPKNLVVIPNNITVRYGNAVRDDNNPDIIDMGHYMSNGGYVLRDSETGQNVTVSTITGYPRPQDVLEINTPPSSHRILTEDSITGIKFIEETTGNYRLDIDSVPKNFTIIKAILTVKLRDHGYDTNPMFQLEYGRQISMLEVVGYDYFDSANEAVFNNPEYWANAGIVASDSEGIKIQKMRDFYGGIVLPHDFATEIGVSSPDYYCYVNPNAIAEGQIFGRVVNAGVYSLTATGFTTKSGFYEVKVVPGKILISRKTLTPQFSGLGDFISRTYGNNYVDIAFNGILSQDEQNFNNFLVYMLNANGEASSTGFTAGNQQFIDRLLKKDNPSFTGNNNALDPLKPVTATNLTIQLDNNVYNSLGSTYVLENYRFNFATSYEVRVQKRPVSLRVESADGSATVNTIYGSAENVAAINYRINYQNIAPHESAVSLGINKGGEYEPNINFRQNAGNTILSSVNVGFPFNVLSGHLNNYSFTVMESNLVVARKPIHIFVRSPHLVDNRMQVLYERILQITGETSSYNYEDLLARTELGSEEAIGIVLPGIVQRGYNIGAYIARIVETSTEAQGKIVYGQFGANDFYAVNSDEIINKYTLTNRLSGFVYDDDFNNVFMLGYTSANYNPTPPDQSPQTYFEAVNSAIIPIHQISTSYADINNYGSYTIGGLSFLSNTNYSVVYEPMDYELIYPVAKIAPASDGVVLSANKPNLEGYIKVDAFKLNSIGVVDPIKAMTLTYGTAEARLTKTASSPDESTFTQNNQNYYLELQYNDRYKLFSPLTSYNMSLISGKQITIAEARGATNNLDNTIEVANRQVLSQVPIRIYDQTTSRLSATFSHNFNIDQFPAGQHLSGGAESTASYDRVETSIRIMPVLHADDYSVRFIINGTISSGNYVMLEFMKGVYGQAFVRRYDSNALKQEMTINIQSMNIFDGFTHDIVFVFDKRLGSFVLTYDYKTSEIINLQDIGTTLTGTETSALVENSSVGFELINATAYLRYYNYVVQGYYDNQATVIKRVNVGANGLYDGRYGFHMVMRDNKVTSASLDIRNVFSPYRPNATTQRFEYYINGILVKTIAFADEITSELATLTFAVGMNKLEVYVYDNAGGSDLLICREIVPVLLDFNPYSFAMTKQNDTTQIPSNGGSMKFYTPTSYNPNIGHMDSPPMNKFNLTQYAGVNSAMANAPLVRSVEYTMSFEIIKFASSDGPEFDSGTRKMSFNMYMSGATYSVDEGNAYRGVSLVLSRTPTSSKYTGVLHFANREPGHAQSHGDFRVPLPGMAGADIDFDDGGIYTIGMYLDRDEIRGYNGISGFNMRKGGDALYIRISKNGSLVFEQYVDNEYAKAHSVPQMTYSNPNYDMLSPIWLSVPAESANGVSIGASRCYHMHLYNLEVNKSSRAYSNYLVDGAYSMRNLAGNAVDATAATKKVELSDNNGLSNYAKYNNATIKYNTISASNDGRFEWHILGDQKVLPGLDNPYYKGMKLVYNSGANNLIFQFYLDSTNYLEQPLIVPASGLLNAGGEHTLRVVFDRERHSTTIDTAYNVMAGALPLTQASGLPIHYGTATIYIDNLDPQTVYFPYYKSEQGWFRPGNDITSGQQYQGEIIMPTTTPAANDENAFGQYPQFLNSFNFGEFNLTNASLTLLDYSSQLGNNNVAHLPNHDTNQPAV